MLLSCQECLKQNGSDYNNKKQAAEGILGTMATNKVIVFRHKTLEERTAEYGERPMLEGEFDWGEPVGREVW